MPVTQDRLTRLREFGLSEYAARSYLALLDLGIAEARDVSSLSKVPQAKIYHVLEQLHDKGLVVILPEFPKKYAPVPFEEYLTRLFDEHKKAAESIEDQRSDLAEMFRVMGDMEVGDRGFFTVIRGRRNVLARIEEMVAQTKKDLVVLGTAGTASRATSMAAELRRALDRHVRIRILAPVNTETLEKLEALAQMSELRARELDEADQSAKVAIVISDSSKAFLIHFVPDDANLYVGKDIGVFTDQEAMVAAIQAIVEPHWTRARTYEARRDEIIHGRVAEFTHVYTSALEARPAIERALAAGPADVCQLNKLDLEALPDATGTWRAVYDIVDTSEIATHKRSAIAPGYQVRHLRSHTIMRQLTIGERDAFFGLTGDVIIHTNAPAVVKALRAHFETQWALGASLEERSRELEIFPGLQPGDVGIGRLFHILRDGVVVVDAGDRIAIWNPVAAATFGYTETRDLALPALVAPAARPEFIDRLARFRNESEAETSFFETEGRRANGEHFPLEITLSLLRTAERGQYIVAVARDITARRQAQAAQSQADVRVRHAYERMTEAFYALDTEFRFVYRNPVVRAMATKKTDEEIDGQVLFDAFPDLAGTKFESELKRAMHEKKPVRFEDFYPTMGMWFEVNAYPSEDGLSVYFRNTTAAKASENALRKATIMLKATLDATPDGILVIAKDGTIAGHNRKFHEMWRTPEDILNGGDDERAVALAAEQLVDPEAFREKIAQVYATPEAESHDVLRLKDGRIIERFSKPQIADGEIVGRVWSFRELAESPEPRVKASSTAR